MINQQDTRTKISFVFEKFRVLLFHFYEFFNLLSLIFLCLLSEFAREIGARVAKTDPVAHARRLTVYGKTLCR